MGYIALSGLLSHTADYTAAHVFHHVRYALLMFFLIDASDLCNA